MARHPMETMTAAEKPNLISVEDYLAGELESPIKHEYLGGTVYAMAGTRISHNIIANNTLAALHNRLRGRPCRPFSSDIKVRVQLPTHVRFYYPDVSVVCRSNPGDFTYQDEPVVIVEVLSQSTRRIDGGEKKDAYLTIPSLVAYVMLEQETACAVVHRRVDKEFVGEVYDGVNAIIRLPEIGVELPLAELYEGVEFIPEPDDEEQIG
jgi:Uma2 family endonuclease